VFHKGHELYGLFEARGAIREAGFALVTEGYMDVVALAQLGFGNAVATLGTACTAEHIAKLLRFTDSVVFSFDGDAAGRRAARKALDAALPHAGDTRSIKFLFLPSEHDPDSFVREHGANAFSRHIADAVPLSRFLVEAASEQCDLGTPEGRAHMASNARMLWEPLPDGALKRQLLGELATLAQLDALDLQEVWQQAATRLRPPAAPVSRQGTAPSWRSSAAADSPTPAPAAHGARRRRGAPVSRSDHAARLLLSHMDFIDTLSHEDNALLCAQPDPHGPLFSWLETQFHEHGALPWAVLRESLRGHSCEALAERVMTGAHAQTEGDTHELRLELRGLINRMLAEQLRTQETEALAAAGSDPTALQRYRALQARRVALERLAPQTT
jgi:DNA primase